MPAAAGARDARSLDVAQARRSAETMSRKGNQVWPLGVALQLGAPGPGLHLLWSLPAPVPGERLAGRPPELGGTDALAAPPTESEHL